ncbi:sigma-70 family RNA polymerase sigma factor [Paenibacillus guangzhouensis]|uniref:sigma-70 family RNA polymerase sigma factor n=1 Tax=Paenibacillus guangzhouensis TaxID=1473112 RepID=UPI00126699A1|nr:sigma-70 family RNA polymerase sigma factor [Paenibacillus guangzhouensis]
MGGIVLDVIAKLDPYLPGLRVYCRSLAGNEWDAEDLVQDVLTKTLNSIWRSPERPISRAFLYRIAKNAWIDQCRAEQKRRRDTTFDEDYHQPAPVAINEWLARELLEQLAVSLNPRQMVLIILIDVFSFSAAESAALLHMTEGAVKEGLKRARRRLRSFVGENGEVNADSTNQKRLGGGEMTTSLFETFLEGFRRGDAGMICRAYLNLAAQGVTLEKVSFEEGRYSFTIRDPDGHLIEFFQTI